MHALKRAPVTIILVWKTSIVVMLHMSNITLVQPTKWRAKNLFVRKCTVLTKVNAMLFGLFGGPKVLGLLHFTHSRKAAFAIWCFDLTTEFQPGMLNLPSFFLPAVLIAEDDAASRALVRSAYKFSISSRCFSSVQLKFWQCLTSVGNCSWSSRFLLYW